MDCEASLDLINYRTLNSSEKLRSTSASGVNQRQTCVDSLHRQIYIDQNSTK